MKLFCLPSVAILGLVIPTAYAGCYTGGEVGDQNAANANIQNVCSTANLGGNYGANTIKSFCLGLGSVRYNFYIYNLQGNTHYMDPNGCVTFMQREIGCQYGGDRTYSDIGWRFIADPNRGSC